MHHSCFLESQVCITILYVLFRLYAQKRRNLERKGLQRSHLGKREGFRNFHHLLLRWRKTFRKESGLRIHDTSCPEPAESPISPYQWPSMHFAFTEQCFWCTTAWGPSNSFCSEQPLGCIQLFGQQVTVYDSKYSGKLHPSACPHLKIFRNWQRYGDLMLEIKVPTVQQQFGSCDCGLFVIAFTLNLAMGDDPQHILFEQSQMRSHLLKCFPYVILMHGTYKSTCGRWTVVL